MEIIYQSDKGTHRQSNEDYVGAFTNKSGIVLAMIADGVTTQGSGDVASAIAVSHFGFLWEATEFDNVVDARKWVTETAVQENQELISVGERYEDLKAMATTMVAVIIFPDEALIANLGDSRAYLFREKTLEQLTFDHSYGNELRRAGERVDDSPMMAMVTRFLGVDERAEVEFSRINLQGEDMIMLSTDGLYKEVDDQLIANQLAEVADGVSLFEDAPDQLIDLANQQSGKDNVTVLLARVEGVQS